MSKIKQKFNPLERNKNFNSTSYLHNLSNPSSTPNNISNLININRNFYNKNKNNNNFNFYSPRTFPKFPKINSLSPLNYLQKYNFLFKNKSLQNLTLKNNNASKILNNNSKYLSSYDNNNKSYTKKLKKNFSDYFYKSQSNLYSSKRIFRHYIHESENEKIIPERFFRKYGAPKHKKEIDELYKLNINYHKRIEEIKKNKAIAFKKDFDILSYQTTLLKLVSKKMSEKNLKEMQSRYINFNQKMFGIGNAPRGRFTNLAEKIKYNVPLFLYERIKRLDKEKLMSRYNYFKKAHENMHNNFEKMYYKTHKKLFKKKQERNKSKDNSNDIYNREDNKYKSKSLNKGKIKNKSLMININYNNKFNLSF